MRRSGKTTPGANREFILRNALSPKLTLAVFSRGVSLYCAGATPLRRQRKWTFKTGGMALDGVFEKAATLSGQASVTCFMREEDFHSFFSDSHLAYCAALHLSQEGKASSIFQCKTPSSLKLLHSSQGGSAFAAAATLRTDIAKTVIDKKSFIISPSLLLLLRLQDRDRRSRRCPSCCDPFPSSPPAEPTQDARQ